jgi:glucan phosphoethanolaminetransferase (alkaline phosphatase superfamily)
LYIFPLSFNSAYFISQIIEYIDVLAKPQKQKEYKQKDIRAINHTDKNIVLIFGESLREDIFRDGEFYQKYKDLKNFHYSKATTLGTNTDVVVPLFINATNDLNNLNRDRNLFKLAKKEGYKTYFFSTQYDKALKYINGYLELDSIDEYANGKKSSLDEFLIEKIKGVDFGQRSLVVLQMYGTHSPYKRYPKEYKKFNPKDNSLNEQIKSDYKNSFLYTEYILDRLLNHIKDSSKKETIVIFVSDHGELINSEYGHNQFKKEIYTVPSFVYTINSNYSFKKKDIYQLDLANIVLENLGYEKITVKRPYKVNGTMITGEDGFILVN